MTDNDPTGSTPSGEEPALSRQQEPDTSEPAEDPGYLTVSGQAVGEDGSVAPIIGGLPAVEGSAWDIGAPLDDRGAGLADQQGSPPDQAGREDTRSS
ncbi:MAG: hypothetical protein JO037_24260 [Actinobacteria bacterium]|nr:hypothetical protein [Actinomycetota bacterium]